MESARDGVRGRGTGRVNEGGGGGGTSGDMKEACTERRRGREGVGRRTAGCGVPTHHYSTHSIPVATVCSQLNAMLDCR